MIQPVMIPIPQTHFQTHMAQQMPQQMEQQMSQQIHQQMAQQMAQQMHPHISQQMFQQVPQQMAPQIPQQATQQIPQQILQHLPEIMQHQQVPQEMPQQQHFIPRQQQSAESFRDDSQPEQAQIPRNPLIHHIIQQIINERIQAEKQNEMSHETNDIQNIPAQYQMPPNMDKLPIPEEVLSQINRLPNSRGVIVAVSEQEPEEAPEEIRLVQQRQNMPDMEGKQMYAREMMNAAPYQIQEEQQATASEESRPHCK